MFEPGALIWAGTAWWPGSLWAPACRLRPDGPATRAIRASCGCARRILASKEGYGFILPEEEAIAFRRAGKQVLNAGAKGAAVCLPLGAADHLAVIGDNGKILIFPTAELPEMPRGKGVKLQSYREGGLRDATAFNAEEGSGWIDSGGRNRQWPEWREWLGKRAGAGKLAPKGFPTGKRFRPG